MVGRVCLALCACVWLYAGPARGAQPGPDVPNWMAAHFIDVGQGQAILLEFSCGAALVDVGGQEDEYVDGNARLMAYLRDFFARRTDLARTLDLVLLTHAHGDHTSGAALPRKANPRTPQTPGLAPPTGAPPYVIRNVVTNAELTGSGSGAQNALNAYADARGLPHRQARASDIPRPEGMRDGVVSPIHCRGPSPEIRLLWGSTHEGRAWESNGNNQSLVVRVDFGRSSFLILGDLEDTAQRAMMAAFAAAPSIFDVDVYAPAHHGSRNGTIRELVAAASPKIAVISSGDPSRPWSGLTARDFAHPNIEALKILQDPEIGVRWKRPAKVLPVGLKGRNPKTHAPATFGRLRIERAIYDTGWDGDVIIEAAATGEQVVVLPRP